MIQELSVDCGCAMVACQDDFSGVGSEECDCADCLEAKIQACRGTIGGDSEALKEYNESKHKGTHKSYGRTGHSTDNRNGSQAANRGNKPSALNSKPNSIANIHCHGRWAGRTNSHQVTVRERKQPKPQRKRVEQPQRCIRLDREHFTMSELRQDSPEIPQLPQLLPERIDIEPTKKDYNESEMMLFVNNRIQQNLFRHQQKKQQERLDKLEEDLKRKQQLEQLKIEARMIVSSAPMAKPSEKKPWNYTEQQPEVAPEPCCHKIPLKPKVDTKNYSKQQLQKQEFLKSIYKRIKQEMAVHRDVHRNPEPCQYHEHPQRQHSPKEIDIKIKENAKKVMEQMALQSQKQKEEEKLIEAKLRGLALEAQKKLSKSKKHGVDDRPEFKYELAIEELRAEKENKQKQLSQAEASAKQAVGEKGDSKKANKASKSSKGKMAGSNLVEKKRSEPHENTSGEAVANPEGKFYVWDVPIRSNETLEVFKPNKPPSKPRSNFREEVEQHIQANQQQKLKAKVAKNEQQRFAEKVEKKKAEILKEYTAGTMHKELEPSLTDVVHMSKDMIKRR